MLRQQGISQQGGDQTLTAGSIGCIVQLGGASELQTLKCPLCTQNNLPLKQHLIKHHIKHHNPPVTSANELLQQVDPVITEEFFDEGCFYHKDFFPR